MKSISHLMLSAFVASAALAGVAGSAAAQLLAPTHIRCQGARETDAPQAAARYQWALHCRYNVPPSPPGQSYTGEQWLTLASESVYNNPVHAAYQNRLYPVYFDFVSGQSWEAPTNATAACTVRPDYATNAGLCVQGCYVEGTALQFADGPVGIKSALERGKSDLVTLAPTATLDNLDYVTNKVENYTKDMTESWQEIYTLSMKSGKTLRVTGEHPLLGSDGVIRQAQGLLVGQELVRANGAPDPVVAIKVNSEFVKVYNVKPVTTDYTSNIIVAGGYLNGSARYQNEFLDTINSMILRRAFAKQLNLLTSN
jgi:hypothetical protein